jgi:hypothetical protein
MYTYVLALIHALEKLSDTDTYNNLQHVKTVHGFHKKNEKNVLLNKHVIAITIRKLSVSIKV